MSYQSDHSASGGGVAAVFVTIVLVGLGIGLKVMSRVSRTMSRSSYNQSDNQAGTEQTNPDFYSRDGARQTSSVLPGTPINSSSPVMPSSMRSDSILSRMDPSVRAALSFQQRRTIEEMQQVLDTMEAQPDRRGDLQSRYNELEARLAQQGQEEADRQARMRELTEQAQRRAAEMRARMEQEMRGHMPPPPPPPFSSPPPVPGDPAAERARAEQEGAELAARYAKQQADLQAQREREAEARRAANGGNGPGIPPASPFAPPAQPPVTAPAPNPDAPPGFAVTAISQVKPKDIVFVKAQDGWYPALVQLKRGLVIQIKYTTNGIVEQVSMDRVRLQIDPAINGEAPKPSPAAVVAVEPIAPMPEPAAEPIQPEPARPQIGLPSALRPVGSGRTGNKTEPEDDALVVAKPNKGLSGDPLSPMTTTRPGPATSPVAKPAAAMRTWTNDTGAFKVEAELVSFEFDLVQLRKKDGKVISIRIDQLSAADQIFIRQQSP